MAIRAFCQQLFKTFFKNFSNARKPFIFAASQAFHTLEYPDIFKNFFLKIQVSFSYLFFHK